MSATGGISQSMTADISRARQFGKNVRETFATLLRTPRPVGRRSALPSPLVLVLGAAIVVAAVGLAMLLFDGWALRFARGLPVWFVETFEVITDFGLSGWFLWPTGLALLAMAFVDSPALARMTRGVAAAVAVRLGFIFLAVAVPGLFITAVKRLVGRARPWVADTDVFAYQPWNWAASYASFPSGHAATAGSVAIAIGALWPRARGVMWTYALVIGASRVIVGAHHPSDVVAGLVIGALGAVLVRNWFAARRLAFVVDSEGRVRNLPGPSWRRVKAVAAKPAAP